MTFLLPFGGLLGLLIWFWLRQRGKLDKDRDQHHLASMLISIAAGRDEVSREDLRTFIAEKGWSRGQAVPRLSHAVKLAGTAVSGELYDKVVALARELG